MFGSLKIGSYANGGTVGDGPPFFHTLSEVNNAFFFFNDAALAVDSAFKCIFWLIYYTLMRVLVVVVMVCFPTEVLRLCFFQVNMTPVFFVVARSVGRSLPGP